jgi:hypothetical protein
MGILSENEQPLVGEELERAIDEQGTELKRLFGFNNVQQAIENKWACFGKDKDTGKVVMRLMPTDFFG